MSDTKLAVGIDTRFSNFDINVKFSHKMSS